MSIIFEKLFDEIRMAQSFETDDLEKLFFDIIDRNRKTIAQKKAQIERTLGEITQLQAFESTLFSSLKGVITKRKQVEADKVRTDKLVEMKREIAKANLEKALEDDGLEFGNKQEEEPEEVVKEPIKVEEKEIIKEDEPQKKTSKKIKRKRA